MRMRSKAAIASIRTAMPACWFVLGTESPNESGDGGVAFPTLTLAGNKLGEHLFYAVGGSDVASKAKLLCSHDFLQSRRVNCALIQRSIEARTGLIVAEASVEDEQKRKQRRSCDSEISENGHCLNEPPFGRRMHGSP